MCKHGFSNKRAALVVHLTLQLFVVVMVVFVVAVIVPFNNCCCCLFVCLWWEAFCLFSCVLFLCFGSVCGRCCIQ